MATWQRREFLRATGTGAAVFVAGCGGRSDPPSREAWSHYRADAARTGFNPHAEGPVTDVSERWAYTTEARNLSSPAVVAGRVYVNGDRLYALDAGTGEVVWDHAIYFASGSPPAVVDGTAYVASRHALLALGTADGSRRWDFSFGNWTLHAPAVTGSSLYFGTTKAGAGFEGRVYALDAKRGTVRWKTDVGRGVLPPFTLAADDDTVYAGKERVYALDRRDGSVRWTFDSEDSTFGTPAVHGDTVYVGSVAAGNTGAVYALDAETGSERWRVGTGLTAKSLAVDGETVFVASDSVYALSASDGTERWRHPSNRFVQASPAVTTDAVYLGSILGTVVALGRSEGRERWRVTTPSSLLASPAVAGDAVVVAGADRTVYVFGE